MSDRGAWDARAMRRSPALTALVASALALAAVTCADAKRGAAPSPRREAADVRRTDPRDAADVRRSDPRGSTGMRGRAAADGSVEVAARAGALDARFPSRFFDVDDTALRRSLATSAFASAKKGSGGRSVGFKITLADGTVGYFKPEQEFSGAHYYSELAAHYLDRELGFGRVTPATGRVFAWSSLRPLLGADPRASEVTVRDDGTVRGAFLAWIAGGIEPLPLGRGWETWVRVSGPLARTPYTALGSARDREVPPSFVAGEPDTTDRAAELSDLLVFDYLVQNVDRWGSQNTNVRTKGRGGPLLFFDNGAGFWLRNQRLPLMESRLRPVERFRRSTIDAIRAFDRAHFEARLATDPLAPLLTSEQLHGLEERISAVLAHVETMRARHGDAIWF